MIAYTMVGANDLTRARAFYEPLMREMNLQVRWDGDGQIGWGRPDDETVPHFLIGRPFNGEPATVGNGVMTAFIQPMPAQVDVLYGLAMANGGSSEGQPGLRPQYGPGFYAAYVRDPEGNKLAFVCYRAESADPGD